MAGTPTADRFTSQRPSRSQLYSGKHDLNHHDQPNDQRNDRDGALWRRCLQLFRSQRHSFWPAGRSSYDLHGHRSKYGVSAGNSQPSGRLSRAGNRDSRNHNRIGYGFSVGLLAVSTLGLPAIAEDGVTGIANPVATSTGSVNNQAVQINQGGFSEQSFSVGHRCNSSTLTLTPFYLGNDRHPTYNRTQNFGAQISVSIPLNREMIDLCVRLAKKRLEKERMDIAFVRFRECAKLLKMGYKIRSDSPFAIACEDIVPLNAVVPKSPLAAPVPPVLPSTSLQPASKPASLP